jgi:hypothetical protein
MKRIGEGDKRLDIRRKWTRARRREREVDEEEEEENGKKEDKKNEIVDFMSSPFLYCSRKHRSQDIDLLGLKGLSISLRKQHWSVPLVRYKF